MVAGNKTFIPVCCWTLPRHSADTDKSYAAGIPSLYLHIYAYLALKDKA